MDDRAIKRTHLKTAFAQHGRVWPNLTSSICRPGQRNDPSLTLNLSDERRIAMDFYNFQIILNNMVFKINS